VRAALVLPGQGSQRPGSAPPGAGPPAGTWSARASEQLDRDVLSLLAVAALPPLDVVAVAGHSPGDLTALVVGGVVSGRLTAPIRWHETLLALPPVDLLVEAGPGGVLTGLVRRTLPGVRAVSVSTPDDLEQLR
jgi:[acyl-carrier-protein] S-malonyltransferase